MSRIDDLIAEQCTDGVEFKAICEIAEYYSGATPASGISAYWENGTTPWMSSGEVNKGIVYDTDKKISKAGFDSCSTKMVPKNVVVIALAGQGKTRGTVARTRLSLCSIIINTATIDSDFLYYFLSTQYQQLRSVSSGDGTRGGLNLQIADVPYISHVNFVKRSHYNHQFSFVVPKSKRAPERILRVINDPNKDTAKSTAFTWLDTKEVRPSDSQAFTTILNDRDRQVGGTVQSTLRSYDITSITWSKREDFRERLAA